MRGSLSTLKRAYELDQPSSLLYTSYILYMQKIRENMQRPGTYHHTIPLKTPEQLEALAKQLRPVLGSIYEKVRTQSILLQQSFADNQQQVSITTQLSDDSMRSKKALEAYETWQTSARSSLTNPQVEFCLQTTYMQFVRTFFVRACEDNGLTSSPDFSTYFRDWRAILYWITPPYTSFLSPTPQRNILSSPHQLQQSSLPS